MSVCLKIVSVGDPVLRTVAQPLSHEELRSTSIQNLIELMRETVRDAPGVGLAAPQIGQSIQLAVIEDRREYHKTLTEAELQERGRKEIPFHVIINPAIELLDDPTETFFEGCLSVPGLVALVPRAKNVRVRCLDDRGEPRVIDASGWYARILQHEIDHLRGELYVDLMESRSLSTTKNHADHWRQRDSGTPTPTLNQ